MRRRRRRIKRDKLTDFFNHNNSEGLEIHKIKDIREVSRCSHRVCMFDGDHIVIELGNNKFRHVSIAKQARKVNAKRSSDINPFNTLVNSGR